MRMPPEWSPQHSVWLTWPHRDDLWAGDIAVLQKTFAEIAAHIAHFQQVDINASATLHPDIQRHLTAASANLANICLHDHPANDVWCRDHGPIFVKNDSGHLVVTNWGFNGWGNKFAPYDLDDQIPECIANTLNLPLVTPGLILEGGSIEINSHGQLLTTEAVLLNENRNPTFTRALIETALQSYLGATEILWLKNGIKGDDTDGHIDDLTRFTDDSTILTSVDPGGPNETVLAENYERLKTFRTVTGVPFTIHTIPLPDPVTADDWRLPTLPASYVNFLIINGAVLIPVFDQEVNDQRALDIIAPLFPGREIIAINCLALIKEGGALHCISQQQPA